MMEQDFFDMGGLMSPDFAGAGGPPPSQPPPQMHQHPNEMPPQHGGFQEQFYDEAMS